MFMPLRYVGRTATASLSATFRILRFSSIASLRTLISLRGLTATGDQAIKLCLRCVIPVASVIGPIGAMLALQAISVTDVLGVKTLLAPLITTTIIREIAPTFSGIMICFQAGAGITAELGAMGVQQELAAIEVMGIDLKAVVAGPRILGAILAAPLLNMFAIAVGVLGSYIMAIYILDFERGMFMQTMWTDLDPIDIWLSELKSIVFGIVIGSVSTAFGFLADGGAAGVGRATNRTVITTVILVLMSNYALNTVVLGSKVGGLL